MVGMSRGPLWLGLGSPHGDDQAGWLTIDALHRRGVPSSQARCLPEPSALWNWVTAESELILIDAAFGTGDVGTIRQHLWPRMPLPLDGPRHGHRLPLGEVLNLGRMLQLCPATVEVWTIEGRDFVPETNAASAVLDAVERLAELLLQGVPHA